MPNEDPMYEYNYDPCEREMKRTTPMYGHTQQIQIAIAKDPLYRKNQQTMCIQDPTHIFSFLLLTNYLVEAKCMPGDTHPVLSQKHSQDFRIVACLDESPSRFVHVGEIPFLRSYQKKQGSQPKQ